MLSIYEVMTYSPECMVLLVFLMIVGVAVVATFVVEKGKGWFLWFVCLLYAVMMIIVILSFTTATIESATITPCSIVRSGRYCDLVVDISENEYYVCSPELSAKLHINQTRNVKILNAQWNRPEIVDVEGKYCLPGTTANCIMGV